MRGFFNLRKSQKIAVIPAKAGIHLDLDLPFHAKESRSISRIKMDSRLRGNDEL